LFRGSEVIFGVLCRRLNTPGTRRVSILKCLILDAQWKDSLASYKNSYSATWKINDYKARFHWWHLIVFEVEMESRTFLFA
ncbi:MAG: hypothetical protein NTZ28_01780, partial [Nitrospirae bacterium]|nr:hypothetical protein [Nitrospirota bacterium]